MLHSKLRDSVFLIEFTTFTLNSKILKLVSISYSPPVFAERRNEALQVSFVDGYENRKMFYTTNLACENESKTNSICNFITEKNINVVIMTDITEVTILLSLLEFYCLQLL